MSAPNAWLEFPSGERIFLTGHCTVGRGPDNRVVIPSERVSRRHAVLRLNETGTFTLMDLGSSNGTYLNGQRITRAIELSDFSIIEIGSQKMTFRTPPGAPGAAVAKETMECECWLLVIAAVQLGTRIPSEDSIDKTFEGWRERCQRVIAKGQGRAIGGADGGLLAYWRAKSNDSQATVVASTLRSLAAIRQQTEEFRFVLHFGSVTLRPTVTGSEAPSGPEVIRAMQLDRLASNLKCPVLVTESASERLGDSLPTKPIPPREMGSYRGEMRFFTTVEP